MNLFQRQSPQQMDPQAFMSQFQQFKNQFHGNAQQEVQNLLNSGKMTQQQYNQLRQMAAQFGAKF